MTSLQNKSEEQNCQLLSRVTVTEELSRVIVVDEENCITLVKIKSLLVCVLNTRSQYSELIEELTSPKSFLVDFYTNQNQDALI
jgi:hypothetical protein